MEEKGGREMAEIRLRKLFVTCKSQWNGDLSKRRETETTLKATQNALQTLLQQVGSRYKENEKQMKKLQKQLSEVDIHLSKPQEEQHQRTSEETENLLQAYNELLNDSKISAQKTANQLTAFNSIRNAVVSMEIKTSGGDKLAAPLFDSALLNFPAEGANEHESHLQTSLSFLILSGTQKEEWKASVKPKSPTESIKNKKKEIKPESSVKESKEKPSKNDKKDEKTFRKDFDPKKSEEHDTKGAKGPRHNKSQFPPVVGKNHNSQTDHGKKPFQTNVPKQCFTPDKFHRNQHAYHTPTPSPILPSPSTMVRVPEPPYIPSHVYHVPPPTLMSPSISFHNKKAFLALSLNGTPYGKIVIELRPDVAPEMCKHFVQSCLSKDADSYQGTTIYQSKPKTYIMGGRMPGPESIYMADASPLKKTRGSIFLRLKRDFAKAQCSIVSTDFCIQLNEEMPDNYRTTTVFGYVCDGLAVCHLSLCHTGCWNGNELNCTD